MSKRTMRVNQGRLTIGSGKENAVNHITVLAPYGSKTLIDVHISADNRSVFLQLSKEECEELARRLLDPHNG